jgi:lipopolysaccharide biosynthesis glycosyltransferase
MIRIALSTDIKGHPHNATLIASILRRTKSTVHVRCWCRGFAPPSFETGRLKVEFISATEEVTGRYPAHVSTAVFDRLRVIRDSVDWDRCLIMDHDMICLSDLAEYFQEDFEGNLLMGRLFGPGNTVGLQMKARGGLPASHAFAENYPFFFMGPMMNLELMRQEGTWDSLLEAHTAIGEEEQISLTVATGGRTKDVAAKWNQVPQWDFPRNADHPSGLGDPEHLEGIIHWTGPMKPWHSSPKIWRPDLWESEKSSWHHLRNGLWNKPTAIEVEPEDHREISALARRGWRVKVYSSRLDPATGEPADHLVLRLPDVEYHGVSFCSYAGRPEESPETTVKRVRFGRWTNPVNLLRPLSKLPDHLVLQGPLTAMVLEQVFSLGYNREFRLTAAQWPSGGPLPEALDFGNLLPEVALGFQEEIYLELASQSSKRSEFPGGSRRFPEAGERRKVQDRTMPCCAAIRPRYDQPFDPIDRMEFPTPS